MKKEKTEEPLREDRWITQKQPSELLHIKSANGLKNFVRRNKVPISKVRGIKFNYYDKYAILNTLDENAILIGL